MTFARDAATSALWSFAASRIRRGVPLGDEHLDRLLMLGEFNGLWQHEHCRRTLWGMTRSSTPEQRQARVQRIQAHIDEYPNKSLWAD